MGRLLSVTYAALRRVIIILGRVQRPNERCTELLVESATARSPDGTMKANTALTVIVALCCVLAVGATSTTLDSTISTDPEEVTEVDYDKLPIGTGQAQKLDDAIDNGRSGSGESGGSAEGSQSQSESSGGASNSGKDGEQKRSASRPAEQGKQGSGHRQKTKQKQKAGGGDENAQSSGDGHKTSQGGGSGSNPQSGAGRTLDKPSLLERLLSLLRALFDLLTTLLPYAVLAALLAAAVRYRDRIVAWATPGVAADEETDEPDLDPSPQNDVASAWFEMVDRLGLADRRHLTPRECTAAARRRGVDADAAQTLTALFEEVRYGGANVTDERRRRAEKNLRRIRGQLEGER